MRSLVLVVPGRLDTLTGGYLYNRRMAEELRRHGWSVEVRELDESFPYPTPAALRSASEMLGGCPDGARLLVDGLALGGMPDLVERQAARLRIAALIHLPLGADVSIHEDARRRLAADERRSLAACGLVIVTGPAAAAMLAGYDIERRKIAVVEPGTMRAPLARGSGGAPRLQLLTVATLNPNKGYEVLLEALASIPEKNWQLTCAGSLTRHPATVERVRAAVVSLGLEDRVTFLGELGGDALHECYDRADVFVLATRQETYGMAVAEALARGLPGVCTATGAIPDLIGTEAGLVVPVGDVQAFAEALSRVIGDPGLRAHLAAGARAVRSRLRTWDEAVGDMMIALQAFMTHG